jgi:predicted DNA-binding WGR domain protein
MEIYFENRTWSHSKFYHLETDLVLFNVCLRREWGRIGRKKRKKVEYYKTWKGAERVYQRLGQLRIQHGYRVVSSRKMLIQLKIPLLKK